MKTPKRDSSPWDIVLIGSGIGGGAFVSRFVQSGLRILVLEQGEFIKTEPANWEPSKVLLEHCYHNATEWVTRKGDVFHPRVYSCVGGSSKFFGGTTFRFREEDFRERVLDGWQVPPWPFSYEDLEYWYQEAERMMWVHGEQGMDPSEPPMAKYPHPPIPNEPAVERLAKRLEKHGLHPFPLPVAVDGHSGGRCRKGSPCDGFPCRIRAKGDAENAFWRPALKADTNIELRTGIRIDRLVHDAEGEHIVEAIGVDAGGRTVTFRGGVFIVAAGASESALLFLRSKNVRYPAGLCNDSGMVGRHFMAHNNTVLMAIDPLRRNATRFQKTLGINDFYFPGHPEAPEASGNIQMRGKILPENLARNSMPSMRIFRHWIATHSLDFWIMSEDTPLYENRIDLTPDGQPVLYRNPGNMATHQALVRHISHILRTSGYPIVLVQKPDIGAIQHQCGTLRCGTDPQYSVLNANCRSYHIDNLYVCDSSVFPSSAAVNPALTVAANAMRVGEIVRGELLGIVV